MTDHPGYEYAGKLNVAIWVPEPAAMVNVDWPPTGERWTFLRLMWDTIEGSREFYVTPFDGLKLARLIVWHLAQFGQQSAREASTLGAAVFARSIWQQDRAGDEAARPLPAEMDLDKRELLDAGLAKAVRPDRSEEQLARFTFATRDGIADVVIRQEEALPLALDVISCLATWGDEIALELCRLLQPRFGEKRTDAA
jgi:hypothetical protein